MSDKKYPFWKVSPHIFILGAGASRASFPKGDKYGRKLPLMSDFIEIVGLESILSKHKININNNIEDIYDSIYSKNPNDPILQKINDLIYSYFSTLQIPEEVTLYDRLLLSLQSKDVIFSFNWDPLLLQAYIRNISVKELPKLHFLHGNVAVGVCYEHRISGHLGNKCSVCGQYLKPSKLLFPIKDKDYARDQFIESEWKALKYYLANSFILTIFGYSAPKTDVKAIEMMKLAWKRNKRFEFNEIQIIDILPREKVEKNWENFIFKSHYSIHKSIETTLSFIYARRSCEHWGDSIMMLQPWSERRIPNYKDLMKLQNWIKPLIDEEILFREKEIEIPRYSTKNH